MTRRRPDSERLLSVICGKRATYVCILKKNSGRDSYASESGESWVVFVRTWWSLTDLRDVT